MQCKLDARHHFLHMHGVPHQWKPVVLGDLARVVGGGTPSRDEGRFWNGGTFPWATPTDLTQNSHKYITRTAEFITEAGVLSSAATLLPIGTILFTSRATIGAKAIAAVEMATNQGFASFIPESVHGDYLYYLLGFLTPIIKRLGAGTTFDEVSKRDIRTVHCAVPTEETEQKAVAGILDAVDTAVAQVGASIECAVQLKRSLIQRFFYSALGETAYADRPTKPLPSKWSLLPTNELIVGEPKNGVSPTTFSQPPGTPTFSIGAIRDGRVDLAKAEHLKFAVLSDKIADKFRVAKGDVLIVRGNANPDLVGKAGQITTFPDGCIYPDITMRVKFREDVEHPVTPEFGVMVWNHPIVHNQVLRRAKTSNGTLKINKQDVKQMTIPVPPLDEQESITRLAAACDEKIVALSERLKALEELKKSLMHDLLTGAVRVDPKLFEEEAVV